MTSAASRPPRRLVAALAALLLALAACALVPAHARADGDPGSDELLEQNLYYGSDDGISLQQELQLGKLLNATAAAGRPVRVAIIGRSDDLGYVTQLWREPQPYAEYLGAELKDTYTGRLLVVMPSGFGVYWDNKLAAERGMAHAIGSLGVAGDSAKALVAATDSAVYRLEAAVGVSQATLARHGSSGVSAAPNGANVGSSTPVAPAKPAAARTKPAHGHPDAVVIIVAILLLLAYVAWRRGLRPPKLRLSALERVRVKPIALLPAALLAIVVAALVINHSGSSGSTVTVPGTGLNTNPNLDQGTLLHSKSGGLTPAPAFTLTDETGRPVSLSQYRGKVVILAFIDAECQTICPLTTEAMLDAKRSLGAAGKDVQLLGIDANYRSTQIDDVLNYTELHGLTGQWHFLTGTLPQLEHVWNVYGVNEKALMDEDSTAIDHVAAVYLIDPQGRLRVTFVTQSAYSAIPQFGQLLAHEVSELLPSHPKVLSHYTYAEIRGITPTQADRLPREGGGTVTLGPGEPHLYLFFATWDKTTNIAGELDQLNAYQRYAKAHGLPALTAVDEGSVEPSPQALPDLLRTLPRPLSYPVAIDRSGRVADGYEVEGEPWFVLTSASGEILSYQEVYTDGWPTLTGLEQEVRASLSREPTVPINTAAVRRELAGSPAPLAKLHAQAGMLLSGGPAGAAFYERLLRLLGYPIVINIWQSTCAPCRAEFHLFASASAQYGKHVAFIGVDNEDLAGLAKAFLRSHPVSYPSYTTSTPELDHLLTGGLEGTPTTVYISPKGALLYVHIGQYDTYGALKLDIQDYALSGEN